MASHKSVIDGDFVYLVGGTSFSVDPGPKFITSLYLGSGDAPLWNAPNLGMETMFSLAIVYT